MSGCGNGDKDKATSTAKSSGLDQPYQEHAVRPSAPDRPSGAYTPTEAYTAAEAYTPSEEYAPPEAYTPSELDEQPKP